MIVGLTGGIGSGKSTVAEFFRELGVSVYDSDYEAKTLMTDSKDVRKAIVALFGEKAYLGEKLNKTLISEIVFNDKKKLLQLNAIVHPVVKEHFLNWVTEQESAYVIQETALIFENNAQSNYDAIILVTAPENIRIQRVTIRDASSEEKIKARMNNQLPDEDKRPLADYVINNLILEKTKEAVLQVHKELLSRARV